MNGELRRFISQKYGQYEQGQLSYEVLEAIKHWIKIHTDAQTTLVQTNPNPTFSVANSFNAVKQYLLAKYYQDLRSGAVVPASFLKDAISHVRGSDDRTVVKWMKIFDRFHLIKYLTPATWEIL